MHGLPSTIAQSPQLNAVVADLQLPGRRLSAQTSSNPFLTTKSSVEWLQACIALQRVPASPALQDHASKIKELVALLDGAKTESAHAHEAEKRALQRCDVCLCALLVTAAAGCRSWSPTTRHTTRRRHSVCAAATRSGERHTESRAHMQSAAG